VWSWIKKGVSVYLEIGPRDIAADAVFVGRRDKGRKERYTLPRAEFVATVTTLLDDIQNNLLARARAFLAANTRTIDSKQEFYDYFTPKNREKPEAHGGFALCHWNGSPEVEKIVKDELNVTIRCIPLDAPAEEGRCVITGEPSKRRVIFAKSY
jgi:prolyl-tRNA synthetase